MVRREADLASIALSLNSYSANSFANTFFAITAGIVVCLDRRLQRFLLFELIKWPEPGFLCFIFLFAVTFTRFARPLCVFCFGIVYLLS